MLMSSKVDKDVLFRSIIVNVWVIDFYPADTCSRSCNGSECMEENGRTVDALKMAHIRFPDRHGIDSRQAVLACKNEAQPVAVATVAHRQA